MSRHDTQRVGGRMVVPKPAVTYDSPDTKRHGRKPKPKKPKPKKPTEISRQACGISIYGGVHVPTIAHQLYEVRRSDGSITIERGLTLDTHPDGPGEGMYTVMAAAQVLNATISKACWYLDRPPVVRKGTRKKP